MRAPYAQPYAQPQQPPLSLLSFPQRLRSAPTALGLGIFSPTYYSKNPFENIKIRELDAREEAEAAARAASGAEPDRFAAMHLAQSNAQNTQATLIKNLDTLKKLTDTNPDYTPSYDAFLFGINTTDKESSYLWNLILKLEYPVNDDLKCLYFTKLLEANPNALHSFLNHSYITPEVADFFHKHFPNQWKSSGSEHRFSNFQVVYQLTSDVNFLTEHLNSLKGSIDQPTYSDLLFGFDTTELNPHTLWISILQLHDSSLKHWYFTKLLEADPNALHSFLNHSYTTPEVEGFFHDYFPNQWKSSGAEHRCISQQVKQLESDLRHLTELSNDDLQAPNTQRCLKTLFDRIMKLKEYNPLKLESRRHKFIIPNNTEDFDLGVHWLLKVDVGSLSLRIDFNLDGQFNVARWDESDNSSTVSQPVDDLESGAIPDYLSQDFLDEFLQPWKANMATVRGWFQLDGYENCQTWPVRCLELSRDNYQRYQNTLFEIMTSKTFYGDDTYKPLALSQVETGSGYDSPYPFSDYSNFSRYSQTYKNDDRSEDSTCGFTPWRFLSTLFS